MNLNEIYISHDASRQSYRDEDGYYFMLKIDYGNTGWRTGIREVKLSCYDLHREIVSLGSIKIKNILTKQFNASISKNYDEPYFKTITEAEKALEWILQQYLLTKMVGAETIEQEKKKKNAANAVKRAQKKQEQIIQQATINLKELQQYIGKDIIIPICINHCDIQFKTKFLSVAFTNDNRYHILTEAGELKIGHKQVQFVNGKILSIVDGRNGQAHVRASGPVNIHFKNI